MFEKELKTLENTMDAPYPERSDIVLEIKADMEAAFSDLMENNGLDRSSAYNEVLRKFLPNTNNLSLLEDMYLPGLKKLLAKLPASIRPYILDTLLAIVPASYLSFIILEVPMIAFLQEAGMIIYAIFALAGLGLYVQFMRSFRWFILKEHNSLSPSDNTTTPLYFAVATLCIGFLGTAMGYYVVLSKWAEGTITAEQFKVGLFEPLPAIITASALAVFIVLVQVSINGKLRMMLDRAS